MSLHIYDDMEQTTEQTAETSFKPSVTTTLFVVGLVLLLLGSILMTILLSGDKHSTKETGSVIPEQSRAGDDRKKEEPEKIESGNGNQDNETASPPAFDVRRAAANEYVFHFSRQFEHLQPGANVKVALYWQDEKLDRYEKKLSVNNNQRVDVELSPGGRRQRLPPGVYRLRVSAHSLVDTPSAVQQFSEYLSAQEDDELVNPFQDEPEAYEYAVAIGEPEQAQQFQEQFLCELRKRGRELIDAWRSWKKMARSAYKSKVEQVELKLFDRFMRVQDAVKRVKDWIQKKEETYVVLPNSSLRGELLKLSYVLSKKVNALSMTVMRQVGASPQLWPAQYIQRGFGPNIHVLYHMEQYDQETIKGVKKALDQSRLSSSYFGLHGYAITRLSGLVQFVDRLHYLKRSPYLQMLRFQLSEEEKMQKMQLMSINRYVQQLIEIRRDGLKSYLAREDNKDVRSSFQTVLTQLPIQVKRVLKDVYEELDLDHTGLFEGRSTPDRSVDEGMKQMKRILRQLREEQPKKSELKPDCS